MVGGHQQASSNLHVVGATAVTPLVVSANTTIDHHSLILAGSSSTNIHLRLPHAGNVIGRSIRIKETQSINFVYISAGNRSIDAHQNQIFLGETSGTILPSVDLVSDGSQWYVSAINSGNEANDSNLLAHFFLEGSSANHIVSTGSYGTTSGTYLGFASANIGVEGVEGKAAEFDSTDNRINVGNVSTLNLTYPFSLSAWIMLYSLPSTDENYIILSKYNSGSTNRSFTFRVNNSNDKLRVTISENGSSNGTLNSNYVFSTSDLNKWRHVCFTITSDRSYTFYINGSLDRTYTTGMTSVYQSTADVMIGGVHRAGTLDDYIFHGKIDSVKVFNKCLSAFEVNMMYQNVVR